MYAVYDSLTKIIATIGPASNKEDTLRKMIQEGLDVCRLNFSHGSYDDHEKAINLIKGLNNELNANVAILADLQGPKLRIGEVKDNRLQLDEGDVIRFVSEECVGTAAKIFMSYKQFPRDVKKGEVVLVDDGKIKLEVVDTNNAEEVILKVISGGVLSSRKGVNLPNTKISLPSLTEKDRADVEFVLQHDIHWIALSFVRNVNDIIQLKNIIKKSGKHIKIVAKIEKPEAVHAIDAIIHETDAIMIARGDLGIETPFNKVPVLQKQIVHKCIMKGKPVIIATQMMEGMITNFLPTRAEATDVSNAVLDGADAVMLSGETSVGKYPVEVIRNMQKVINSTEASGFYLSHDHGPDKGSEFYLAESVSHIACQIANQIDAVGIVVFTYEGGSALQIASYRPNSKIFTFTVNDVLRKQLSLVRGVEAFSVDREIDVNEATDYATKTLLHQQLVEKGDNLVFVVGIPMKKREPVNTIHISTV